MTNHNPRNKRAHEIHYTLDDIKEFIDLAQHEWRHAKRYVKKAYPATLIKADEVDGVPSMLVHFDGMEGEEVAECWVDEDGEDEWCVHTHGLHAHGVHPLVCVWHAPHLPSAVRAGASSTPSSRARRRS